jgi:ankyrin repeat protein
MAASLLQTGGSLDSAPRIDTALMTAARAGDVDAIKELLDRGADVNAKESMRGRTALMWAALENHLDAARLLLERGADINECNNVRAPEGSSGAASGGMTALLFAARQGHQEMAALLLDRGADIKWSSASGTSPLLMATLNGHVELAMKLIERRADPNAADARGRGPLFAAVDLRQRRGNAVAPMALIHALVEKGADVNARTNFDGQTPFLRAALSGDVELMRYLLDHGADPGIGTIQGT